MKLSKEQAVSEIELLIMEGENVLRTKRKDEMLGEQLIVDIEKYKAHPDCEQLICFVYDPEGLLGNPASIKKDLMQAHDGFVEVIISPQ